MEKIYGMHKLVGLQLFWSGTPTLSSGTPTFCQMGALNSCFQNPSESSVTALKVTWFRRQIAQTDCSWSSLSNKSISSLLTKGGNYAHIKAHEISNPFCSRALKSY